MKQSKKITAGMTLIFVFALGLIIYQNCSMFNSQNSSNEYNLASQSSTDKNLSEQLIVGYQGWFLSPCNPLFSCPVNDPNCSCSTESPEYPQYWRHWSGNITNPQTAVPNRPDWENQSPVPCPSPGSAPIPEPSPIPKHGISFDLFPDLREYYPLDLYYVNDFGTLNNGSPVGFFSSDRERVIELHLRWMKDYNIDGLALQRFVTGVTDPQNILVRNRITKYIQKYAELYGKSFYIMYDASGDKAQFPVKLSSQKSVCSTNGETCSYDYAQHKFSYTADPTCQCVSLFAYHITEDWKNQMQQFTASPSYTKQDGKKVVSIWGIGFDQRGDTPDDLKYLTSWFHNKGVYLIAGVPWFWQSSTGDADICPNVAADNPISQDYYSQFCSDPSGKENLKSLWIDAYLTLDVISPWTVGRYGSNDPRMTSENEKLNSKLVSDLDFIKQHNSSHSHKVRYQPVIFPGFAWSNWKRNHYVDGQNCYWAPSPKNSIPRLQGKFLWKQGFDVAKQLSVHRNELAGIYVAMFDEFDEGTAIAKAAPSTDYIPQNQYFLTLDADSVHVTSDFYLRVTSAINTMYNSSSPIWNNGAPPVSLSIEHPLTRPQYQPGDTNHNWCIDHYNSLEKGINEGYNPSKYVCCNPLKPSRIINSNWNYIESPYYVCWSDVNCIPDGKILPTPGPDKCCSGHSVIWGSKRKCEQNVIPSEEM